MTAFGFTEVIMPTKPRSAGVPSTSVVSDFATNVPEVLPEIAAALTPWFLSDCATDGPTSPAKTLSTTVKVSGVVTLKPPTKEDSMPAALRASPICGPPPWTTTGVTPDEIASAIALAKPPCSSVIA